VSRENVEIVKRGIDAYFRGDESAMLDHAAPDIIVTQFPDQLDVRDYRGHEGLLRVMAEWIDIWDDWSVEILRIREIEDRVLVGARQRGRGKGSGAPFEVEVVFVFTVRDDKIARWQMFHSEQQALRAVGLEE
jgi:ketosteroid isomerase-like protein